MQIFHAPWRRALFLAPVLLLLVLSVTAHAYTYYVPDQFPTVQAAIASAETGDTVLVRPGVYQVMAPFAGKQLVVRSTDGPEATILIPFDQKLPIFTLTNTEPLDTEISGFTFTGFDSLLTAEPRSVILVDHYARPRIQNCIFHDNKLIRSINCVATVITIRRNLFYNNTGDFSISLWKGAASVINNTIVNCTGGIFSMTSDIEVLNNIITGCSEYGARGMMAGFDYNDVWANAVDYSDGAVAGIHDLAVNPLFVDAGANNFHLTASSPCINAGHPDRVFNDPDSSRADIGCYPYQIPTGVNDGGSELPQAFVLEQNYPNPFNGSTHISFTLPAAGDVNLSIFNVLGQRVATIADRRFAAGAYDLIWNAADDEGKPVSSGIYLYRVTTADRAITRGMVYAK